ncbi:helix-turn-helix transcriptional regulator [Actinocatenispora rupis]|uniref:helix-turn-helix transcriptional regulator n=1 Tax=Actinocatenispora rupis TaxID=519421 RepID=UPI00194478BF|nr:helix-turn-helix transcriptional regulator [Actinocatenispora rupis]
MSGSVVSPVLVGRAAETGAVRDAYARARSGAAVTVLVSGEAGIGKSRLVTAALSGLPDDPLVLSGGCLELGADAAPYVPFVAVLRHLVRRLGRDRVDAYLPLDGSALGAWLPGVRPAVPALGRTRLLEEMLTLLGAAAAERPVVVVVEDLHWADASSRELFTYLSRNLGDSRVLLVGTVRTGSLAADHPNRRLLAELGRRAELVRVELGPLSRRQVSELLAAIDGRPGDPERAGAVHRRSGGNPLFVEALSGAAPMSAGDLRDLLLDRIADLPDQARALLSVLAVAGAEVPDDLLAEVAGVTRLRDGLGALVGRDLVVAGADGYRIRHDLIRDAVYDTLLPLDRRHGHARYARALAGRDPDAPALAEHWTAAGEPELALPAAWRASRHVGSAHDERLHLLGLVLDGWSRVADPASLTGTERTAVLEEATFAAFAAGRSADGITYATAALDALDPAAEPDRTARLLGLRGRLAHRLDGSDGPDLHDALALVPPGRSDRLRAELLADAAFVDASTERYARARVHAEESLRLADGYGDPGLRARPLLVLAMLAGAAGDTVRSRRTFAEARQAARTAGDDPTYLTTYQWEALALGEAGEYRLAADLCHDGQRAAERLGMARSRGSMLAVVRAGQLRFLGEWDAAVDVVTDALADGPPPLYAAFLRLVAADVARCRGDADRFEVLLRQLTEFGAHRRDRRDFDPDFAVQRIADATARGELDAADSILTGYLDWPPPYPTDAMRLALAGVRLQRARRAAAPRNRRVAAATADRIAALTRFVDAVEACTATRRAYRATFDVLAGHGDLAAADRAADAWRALHNPHELATVLADGAGIALATNNRPGARTRLDEARRIASALGARPLLARVDEMLARARLSPAAEPPATPGFGLTARELDVLRVLARGRSNAQIAAELFVTGNTVATHVARILTKLGVATRTEAAAFAHRAGLLD